MSTWKFGCPLEDRAHPPEVLRRTPDVGADEHRRRMAHHDPLQRVDQLVERREAVEVRAAGGPGRPEVPVGMLVELLPALVRGIERLEERDRVRDMDRHRHPELPRRRPQGIQARVVDRDQPSARVPGPKPEELPHLEAAGTGGDAVAEARRLGLAERRVLRPAVVVEAREHRHAAREGVLPALDLAAQLVAPAAVEVHDPLDPGRVQHRRRARRATDRSSRRRTGRRGGCGRR